MHKREFNPYTASSNARHSLVSWFGQAGKFRISSRHGLNATVVKPANAVLIGWHLVNRTPGERFVVFYDMASEPGPDDHIDWVLTLPPDGTSTAEFSLQIPFFSGLAFTISRSVASGVFVAEYDVEGILLYA